MIIGVVGLGTMGLGIAQVFAAAGFKVLATDAVDAARATAPTRLRAALEPRVAKGALSQDALEATLNNLHIAPTPQDLSPAAVIIEAILETLPAKQALFTSLEACIAPQTILATNTSSLSVAAIAQGLKLADLAEMAPPYPSYAELAVNLGREADAPRRLSRLNRLRAQFTRLLG